MHSFTGLFKQVEITHSKFQSAHFQILHVTIALPQIHPLCFLSTCQVERGLAIGKKLSHYQVCIIWIPLLARQVTGCFFAFFEAVWFNFSLWQVFVSNSLFRAQLSKLSHSVIPLRVSTTLKHTLNHFAIKIKMWKNNSALQRGSRWRLLFIYLFIYFDPEERRRVFFTGGRGWRKGTQGA